MSAELIERKLFLELADLWDVHAQDATPAARRETLRECADALRMLSDFTNGRVDTRLQPQRSPTHRCKVCGAFWIRYSDSWSLCSKECGQCCDNVAMGEQIAQLAITDTLAPADLLTTQAAEIAELRAAQDDVAGKIADWLEDTTIAKLIDPDSLAKAIRDGDWRQG